MKGKFYQLPSVITKYVNTGGGEEIPDGIFGSGVGGNLNLSGNNTFSGPDLEYENITLNTGTYLLGLHTSGTRAPAIYVNNTLTLNSNVRIDNSGVSNTWRSIANTTSARPGGPGGTNGGAGAAAGVADPTGTPGVDQLLPSIGSKGRPGMGVSYGGQPEGGAQGGACTVVALDTLEQLTSGLYMGQQIGGGSGGGSSLNSGGAGHNGGAGGGGGGLVRIYARNIVLGTGTVAYISALSGSPGWNNGTGIGHQHGGYGGNGGIIIVCENFDPRIRLQAQQTGSPMAGSSHAFGGHVYLASKHLSGQYIYQVDGYYHPILLV